MWVYTPQMRAILLSLLSSLALTANAQWTLQQSHTTASLRGIHSIGNGIAWASGTEGTILRTTDAGHTWQTCTIPPAAEHLDFRAIQAFDAQTAIVMSSGKGDLSRLYKTTDACKSWKLLVTNPDPEGFWDALLFADPDVGGPKRHFGVLLGDPVSSHFVMLLSYDQGEHWEKQIVNPPPVDSQTAAVFAASNSALQVKNLNERAFVTGGSSGAKLYTFRVGADDTNSSDPIQVMRGAKPFHFLPNKWTVEQLPMTNPTESAGAFSIAGQGLRQVIVGGDYSAPNNRTNTAWYVDDTHPHADSWWIASHEEPHGYRSSVAYDLAHKTWITVGPNGTDISQDDGRTWQAVHPTQTEQPDADKNWNALSLPFVVGPQGRIGILTPAP